MKNAQRFPKNPVLKELQMQAFERLFRHYESHLTTNEKWEKMMKIIRDLAYRWMYYHPEKEVMMFQFKWFMSKKFYEWRVNNRYTTRYYISHRWLWTEEGFFEFLYRGLKSDLAAGKEKEMELMHVYYCEWDYETFDEWPLYFRD